MTKLKAMHLATRSGWYRFERKGKDWLPAGRALTYWSVTCLTVDPEDPWSVYAGTEHSGIFVSRDGADHRIVASGLPCINALSMGG